MLLDLMLLVQTLLPWLRRSDTSASWQVIPLIGLYIDSLEKGGAILLLQWPSVYRDLWLISIIWFCHVSAWLISRLGRLFFFVFDAVALSWYWILSFLCNATFSLWWCSFLMWCLFVFLTLWVLKTGNHYILLLAFACLSLLIGQSHKTA